MADSISNNEDVIDSRDVIKRLNELESEKAALEEARDEAESDEERAATATDLADWIDDNGEELKALQGLQSEAEGYAPDWHHGATLIRDSYFTEYAEELAKDIGAIKDTSEWPHTHIDWDAAAEALKIDYTEVDFDGVSYWVR